MSADLCPYCGAHTELVGGREIYPYRSDLYEKKYYRCKPCGAYVGCHAGTIKPLGRLANAELRKAKMAAHAAFDPIWKTCIMKCGSAYAWLSDKLGINKENCHIGMFNVELCERVVEACTSTPPQNEQIS